MSGLAGRLNAVIADPRPARTRPVVLGTADGGSTAAHQIPVAPNRPLLPAGASPEPTQAGNWPLAARHVPMRLEPAAKAYNGRQGKAMGAPAAFTSNPLLPRLKIELPRPRREPGQDPVRAFSSKNDRDSMAIDLSTQRLREIWRRAPGDLKLIAMVIPMILLLTLNAAGPRLYTKPIAIKLGSQPMFDGLLSRQWNAIRKKIAHRAGFDHAEDFRSGLDNWSFAPGASAWGYDNMGFVKPAGLGLYRPTLPRSDYHADFIARIDERGLGFVFRAADARNYQAVRLVMSRPGPTPEWHVIRYAVIGGKETSRSDKLLSVALTPEKFFTVQMDVLGDDFTLMVQDKVADFWTDDRLKTGGIGFFCGKGEQARVRHVEVSYQNDALGRFCAFIASDNGDGDGN